MIKPPMNINEYIESTMKMSGAEMRVAYDKWVLSKRVYETRGRASPSVKS